MSDTALEQILVVVVRMERDMAALKGDVSALKGDVSALKGDVSALKGDVSALKTDVAGLTKRQEEMLTAFRGHWSDMSAIHRASREELERFGGRIEGKLSQVNQAIQALKDSLENQDFRSDELARRITRLEVGDKPPL